MYEPGEYALQIAKELIDRMELMELSVESMKARIEGSTPPKRSKTRIAILGSLVPVVVALITWLASVQVERIKSQNTLQVQELVRQKVDDSDRKLESMIARTSDEAAKKAVKERDLQIDRITSKQ